MKLFTSRGDLDALKVVISALEASSGNASLNSLEVVTVSPDDKSSGQLLPCLVHGKVKLFQVNSASQYLHELAQVVGQDQEDLLEKELQWEAINLRPAVLSVLNGLIQSKKLDDSIRSVTKLVKDKFSKQAFHKYSKSGSTSAFDIAVWSDLYPLFHTPDAEKVLTSGVPELKNWFTALSSRPSFVKGVEQVLGSNNPQTAWHPWIKTTFKGTVPVPAIAKAAALEPNSPLKKAKCLSSPTKSVGSSSSKDDSDATLISALKEVQITDDETESAIKGWNDADWKRGKAKPKKVDVVLPVKGERNVMVTSALPYVNNVPHLGNIVGAVLSADVFARFCRLRGYNTLFVCGTDEYGTTTETKALEEGMTPKEICDKYNALHAGIYEWFDCSFDKFGRTTTEKQTEVAQSIFWDLYNQKNLREDSMKQLFCEKCSRFLADRFVEGVCPNKDCGYEDARGDQCDKCNKLINAVELIKPRCKICSNSPVVRESRHIFIDLPKIQPELESWYDEASKKWSNNARVIAKSWIKATGEDKALQPRCITRDLKWGTPVPLKGYENKVFYVWFDAPIGYISITANYTSEWEKWWKNPEDVRYYQFMAKDNVPFHSVIFPATLLGTGKTWTMVNHLMSTEYLNYEDDKFSKSRGIGVFGNDAQETGIPSDIWRFYLMYTRPENADSSFRWEDLMLKTNSELLSNLGNFVNRALKFCKENFEGRVHEMVLSAVKGDHALIALVNRYLKSYVDQMEFCRERDAISNLLNISRLGNQLMQAEKPWKLVKSTSKEDKDRAAAVVSLCVNLSCLLAVLAEPFMPALSATLLKQLNANKDDVNVLINNGVDKDPMFRCCLPPGHVIGTPFPLIKEIKADEIQNLKKRFSGRQQNSSAASKESSPMDVGQLEKEITAQGDIVRQLKASKAEKKDIEVAVAKLLDLKKQMAAVQPQAAPAAAPASGKKQQKSKENSPAPVTPNPTPTATVDAGQLEKDVAAQGEVVRQLKASKADKKDIDAAVAKLLDLKKQFASATGQEPAPSTGSNKKKGGKKK